MSVPPRRLEFMPLSEVRGAGRNPKLHDTAGIAASITSHHLAELPLLDDRTERLVAGHGRIADLRDRFRRDQPPPGGVMVREDGEWLVPIIRGWRSESDEQAASYLIGSNGLTIAGGWDDSELAAVLGELRDIDALWLDGTGFTTEDVDAMLAALPGDTDPEPTGDSSPGGSGDGPGWPEVRVKVPAHVAQAWQDVLAEHDDDPVAAFASLLDIDPGDTP